jgi:hypothetical protein
VKKNEVLEALEREREGFLDLIDGLPEQDMQQPGVAGDWSIKDILVHLCRWEAELVKLLWQAHQGQVPTTVQVGGLDVETVNARWYRESRDRPLERALEDFHTVRNQTLRRVESFSEKDLNDARRYPWLDGKPLWEWIEADSFGHEAEHAAEIRLWLENRQRKGKTA